MFRDWLHSQWRRLKALAKRRRLERDLNDELQFHLAMHQQKLVEQGMTPEEARYAARRAFGNPTQTRETSRDLWTFRFLETLWQDLHYGLRQLRRSPGFTAVAVLSLALGIGATTAVFSLLDTIFLRPLSFPQPDRLVGIWERRLDKPEPDSWEGVSTPTFQDWKQQSQSFEVLTQSGGPFGFILNGSDRAEQITIRYVSDGYFRMMGAKACQGRLLLPEDYKPGQNELAVLSSEAWQRFFGSNLSVVGSNIVIAGKPHQVVGVMCPDFQEIYSLKPDLWMGVNWPTNRAVRMWQVIGRLNPGVTLREAQTEMDVIEARLARQYPEAQKSYGARIQPLQVYLYGNQQKLFLAFLGAVGLLLLIACTNVANLVLSRAATRETEMAVRASMGGGRVRLVRQLLTESLLLSSLGAALGLLLAYGGVRLAVHLSPPYAIPRAGEISVDVRILAFVVLITCLTAVLFGLFPALGASKPDLIQSLKEGGRGPVEHRGARRMQSVLVVAQVAFSLVLLVGAGLMIHNVWRILHASVGFNTDHLTQMYIQLTRFNYMEHLHEGSPLARMKPKAAVTIQGIKERLKALPGVKAVNVTGSGVLGGCSRRPISAEGPPQREVEQAVCYEPVSTGYFRMLQIPVLEGRVFTEGDRKNSPPVAIISESVAKQYFAGQDPIGKLINIGVWQGDELERRQVVGVVGDVRWAMNAPLHSGVYYPYTQLPAQFHWQDAGTQLFVTFLVRSATDLATLSRSMERAVTDVAKDIVIGRTSTADYTRRQRAQRLQFFTWLLAIFAGTALALAAVGVFGVMSYSVSRRTHEIGIRVALGARRGDVIRLILRTGFSLTLIGLAIGLGSAIALVRIIGTQLSWGVSLNEVKPTDPTTLAVAPLLLAVVALAACYIPARRAAKVDPMVALRYE